MKITRTTYYLISGNDRPGEVSDLLNTLQQRSIDLEAIWAYSTPQGRADMYLVPKNADQFQSATAAMGLTATKGTCFRVEGTDEVGALTSTMSAIARQEINLAAVNATVVGGTFGGYIWSRAEDVEKVARALNV